jgi:hypothetical protein
MSAPLSPSTASPANAAPMTLTERLRFAGMAGGAMALLLCATGWVSVWLRRIGAPGKLGRGFERFPLEYAMGMTTGILLLFMLTGALAPLGRSRWVAIPLCTSVIFVSFVAGLWIAGQTSIPPVDGDARLALMFAGGMSVVFGPLAGVAMAAIHAAPDAPPR